LYRTPFSIYPTDWHKKTHLLVGAIAVGGGVGTFITGAGVVVEVLLPSSKGT